MISVLPLQLVKFLCYSIYTFIDIYMILRMLFDYMYNLILRTGLSPISLDNGCSTIVAFGESTYVRK